MPSELEAIEAKLREEPLASYPQHRRMSDGFYPSAVEELKRRRAAWEDQHPGATARYEALKHQKADIEAKAREDSDKRERARALRLTLEAAGFGARELDVLEAPGETEATVAAQAWLTSDADVLLLTGGAGTGKSVAGALLAQRVAAEPVEDSFRLAGQKPKPRGVMCFRAVEGPSLSLFDEDSKKKLARARTVRLLVLDDLGTEMLTDVWRQAVDDVFDSRYRAKLRTVVTSNLTPEAFKERYGARVADRLRHGVSVIRCGKQSMRAP